MEKESLISVKEKCMRDNSLMDKLKQKHKKDIIFFLMVHFMRENLKAQCLMGKELFTMKIKKWNILGTGKMAFLKDKEDKNMKMEKNIMEILLMENGKVREHISGKMANNIKVSLKKDF